MRWLTPVLCVLALSSIGCTSEKSRALAGKGNPTQGDAVVANQTEPRKVDLVEGKETSLGGGVTVRLKSVLYAHLANSQNNSLMVLEATRAGETKSVTLERLYPGPPKYTLVFGLKLAIDYVDAYHSPSTGAVLVLTE